MSSRRVFHYEPGVLGKVRDEEVNMGIIHTQMVFKAQCLSKYNVHDSTGDFAKMQILILILRSRVGPEILHV